MEHCILCNKSLTGSETVRVKKKGVENIKKCSIERNDGLIELMLKKEELHVHVSCRKAYINENMIKSLKRKKLDSLFFYVHVDSQEESLEFDFNLKCIFCNQDAKEDNSNKDRVRTIKMAKTMHSIENHALKRGDSVSETIMQRIRNVDLVAVQAKYHRTCYDTFRFPTTSISAEGSRKRGRPQCDHTITAMNEIYTFIESHDKECQFTINDFKGAVSGKCPDDKTIVKKIKEKYGDQVTLTRSLGRPTIFCFGSAFHEVLQDAWYTAKCADKKEEKLRIVRTAASIILEEFKTTPYDTSQYPPPDRFVESAKADVPECLYTLLEELIVKNKADIDAASRKCVAIAHAIIAACQPRSFTSSAKKARV